MTSQVDSSTERKRRFRVPAADDTVPEALRAILTVLHLGVGVLSLGGLIFLVGATLLRTEPGQEPLVTVLGALMVVFWGALSLLIAVGLMRRSTRIVQGAVVVYALSFLEVILRPTLPRSLLIVSGLLVLALVAQLRRFRDDAMRRRSVTKNRVES